MQVNNASQGLPPEATATSASSGSSSSTAGAGSLVDPNLFVTLLTAQLQAQDPLNPMNPQDMVNQLTQISSLQQLISINKNMQTLANEIAPVVSSQTNPTGNTQ